MGSVEKWEGDAKFLGRVPVFGEAPKMGTSPLPILFIMPPDRIKSAPGYFSWNSLQSIFRFWGQRLTFDISLHWVRWGSMMEVVENEWTQWLPLADPQKYGGCFGEAPKAPPPLSAISFILSPNRWKSPPIGLLRAPRARAIASWLKWIETRFNPFSDSVLYGSFALWFLSLYRICSFGCFRSY